MKQGERQLSVVIIEDSPDARRFIELQSYASDLTEASNALDLAIGASDPDSAIADAAPFLIGFAVVAYCRCFLHSNVRKPLTDHIEIPGNLARTHEQIKTFRNATIAHSQSELAVTYPLGIVDALTHKVFDVSAVTMSQTLPASVVNDFRSHLDAVAELVDKIIEPVRERLRSSLARADVAALLTAAKPDGIERLAADFDPRSRRGAYPRPPTIYRDLDPPDRAR